MELLDDQSRVLWSLLHCSKKRNNKFWEVISITVSAKVLIIEADLLNPTDI